MRNQSSQRPFSQRQLRVGELVKQNLGELFIRNEAKIPSIIAPESPLLPILWIRWILGDFWTKNFTSSLVPSGLLSSTNIISYLTFLNVFLNFPSIFEIFSLSL